jgi:hypothetical protein
MLDAARDLRAQVLRQPDDVGNDDLVGGRL